MSRDELLERVATALRSHAQTQLRDLEEPGPLVIAHLLSQDFPEVLAVVVVDALGIVDGEPDPGPGPVFRMRSIERHGG